MLGVQWCQKQWCELWALVVVVQLGIRRLGSRLRPVKAGSLRRTLARGRT
jgi:hypothetical protein